jgi:hypothetical protein
VLIDNGKQEEERPALTLISTRIGLIVRKNIPVLMKKP